MSQIVGYASEDFALVACDSRTMSAGKPIDGGNKLSILQGGFAVSSGCSYVADVMRDTLEGKSADDLDPLIKETTLAAQAEIRRLKALAYESPSELPGTAMVFLIRWERPHFWLLRLNGDGTGGGYRERGFMSSAPPDSPERIQKMGAALSARMREVSDPAECIQEVGRFFSEVASLSPLVSPDMRLGIIYKWNGKLAQLDFHTHAETLAQTSPESIREMLYGAESSGVRAPEPSPPVAMNYVSLLVEDNGAGSYDRYTASWSPTPTVTDDHEVEVRFYRNGVLVGSATESSPASNTSLVWDDSGAGDGVADYHHAEVMLKTATGSENVIQSIQTRRVLSAT